MREKGVAGRRKTRRVQMPIYHTTCLLGVKSLMKKNGSGFVVAGARAALCKPHCSAAHPLFSGEITKQTGRFALAQGLSYL